ncbi:Cdc25 family phosphatase-like protein Ibp1 [Lophiostoma macrostomum CBS 122681]|uniref:Cdc25 family phosphatase-like protein Ibp1 n=1 Tax=Lophiostoma macrostomum CBS 122681 TaxID=1314788 RepID=A0A6A6TS74_9PLEO|nr:Cdc25 family phosphatase-like protein Ibp1 [Lophiostoma macrostomum CBS 122681]
MSDITLSSLSYITREELARQLQSSSSSPTSPSQTTLPSNIAIIDVRDSDHIGGHIRGSTHVPSSELDYRTAELVRQLKDKEVVVFHCALSQQRGPSAALRYLREKKRLDPQSRTESKDKGKEQKVVVLQGGFTEWQEMFGEDERLTEGFQKDIWEFGN